VNELQTALAWLSLGQQVITAGEDVWNQIKGVLAANGIEADNAHLDAVIADAARRKAQAEADARG
jgi:hypothetical protein